MLGHNRAEGAKHEFIAKTSAQLDKANGDLAELEDKDDSTSNAKRRRLNAHIRMLEDSLDKLLETPRQATTYPSRRVGATRRRSTTTAATVTSGAPNPLLNSAQCKYSLATAMLQAISM